MYSERILRAFEQLSAAQLPSQSDCLDKTIVVVEDEGFRLVLARDDREIQLDVEVTAPSWNAIKNQAERRTTETYRKTAMRSIMYLEFLVNLVDHGFSLTLVECEFLWIASLILIKPPSQSLLELFNSIEIMITQESWHKSYNEARSSAKHL